MNENKMIISCYESRYDIILTEIQLQKPMQISTERVELDDECLCVKGTAWAEEEAQRDITFDYVDAV